MLLTNSSARPTRCKKPTKAARKHVDILFSIPGEIECINSRRKCEVFSNIASEEKTKFAITIALRK